MASKPIVCVPGSLLEVGDGRYLAHGIGAKNVESLDQFAGCVPMILPALGERVDGSAIASHIDGLLLTGARANVEPHHYGGPPFPEDEPIDPARDATVLPLIRACVAAQIPVFGICRGIQELNVALGGSLHYRIHLLPDKQDHRMPQHGDPTEEEIFTPRHLVRLTPGGLFHDLAGQTEVIVNSLHGQGVDTVADDLQVEAVSADGVIEGVRLKNDPGFTVGVQWHAEWNPETHPLSESLFRAFGEAVRARANRPDRAA